MADDRQAADNGQIQEQGRWLVRLKIPFYIMIAHKVPKILLGIKIPL